MSVYKEIGHLVKDIMSRSKQIYPDAADYGVPIKSYDDPIIKDVHAIMKLYQIPVVTKRYSTGATQTFNFDGGIPAVFEAGFEKAEIVFVQTPRSPYMLGYLYVELDTSAEAKRQITRYDY